MTNWPGSTTTMCVPMRHPCPMGVAQRSCGGVRFVFPNGKHHLLIALTSQQWSWDSQLIFYRKIFTRATQYNLFNPSYWNTRAIVPPNLRVRPTSAASNMKIEQFFLGAPVGSKCEATEIQFWHGSACVAGWIESRQNRQGKAELNFPTDGK